jgi:hypothetical protein
VRRRRGVWWWLETDRSASPGKWSGLVAGRGWLVWRGRRRHSRGLVASGAGDYIARQVTKSVAAGGGWAKLRILSVSVVKFL